MNNACGIAKTPIRIAENTYTTKSVVSIEALLLLGDFAEFNFCGGANNWQDWSLQLGGNFTFLLGGFTLAQLPLFVHWEQDQLAAVFLEALNVLLLSFDRLVATAFVNGDTDGLGKTSGQTGTLQASKKTEKERTKINIIQLINHTATCFSN